MMPSVADVYARHGNFVWLTLQRLGLAASDAEDVFQEVFIVVARRLAEFDGRARIETWLFRICIRKVHNHRRRAHRRREQLEEKPAEDCETSATPPDRAAEARQQQEQLQRILDAMAPTKRTILLMYEVEELSVGEIAETLGLPVGTVHSRLRAARQEFEKLARRNEVVEGRALT